MTGTLGVKKTWFARIESDGAALQGMELAAAGSE